MTKLIHGRAVRIVAGTLAATVLATASLFGVLSTGAGAAGSSGASVARGLLNVAAVPPGATLVHPGAAVVCQCAGAPSVLPLITLHRYYVVAGSPASVERFLVTHVPRGGKESEEGRGSLGNGEVVLSLTTTFKAVGPHVYLRQLAYSVAAKSAATSWLRIDAQVSYVGTRSKSERIGEAASGNVTGYRSVGLSGSTGKRTISVSGAKLGSLVSVLNSLPLGPQNNCMEDLNGFDVTITLKGGTALRVFNGLCGGDFDEVTAGTGEHYILADTSCVLIKYVTSLFGKKTPAGTRSALGDCEAWTKAAT